MRWQQTYIGALRDAGHEVVWFGHDPHRVWPWGPARLRGEVAHPDGANSAVGYWNLPVVRSGDLSESYREAFLRLVEAGSTDVLVTYNIEGWAVRTISTARRMNLPWVPLILDSADPRVDNWAAYKASTHGAVGVGFVSEWAFRNAPGECKHRVRIAVPRGRSRGISHKNAEKRIVLFTGARSIEAGIDRFVQAVGQVSTPGVDFVITGQGRGHSRAITRLIAQRREIRDLGMVSEADLAKLISRAGVLVNPRPIGTGSAHMTFPSKIMDYLARGVPVVSTKSPGLGAELKDVLIYTDSDSPSDLGSRIDEVLNWSVADHERWAERLSVFQAEYSPAVAAAEFAYWIRSVL